MVSKVGWEWNLYYRSGRPEKLKSYDVAEDESDQIAKNWGLEKEALRQFHKE